MRRTQFAIQFGLCAGVLLFAVHPFPFTSLHGAAQDAKTVAKTVEAKTARSAKTAADNPLGRLIRNLIPTPRRPEMKTGGNVKMKTGKPGLPDARVPDSKRRLRDHIDSRLPHNSEDVSLLHRVRQAIQDKFYQPALPAVQRLLDGADDTLIRTDDDEWISIRERTNRLIAEAPEEFRTMYRLKYGGEALAGLERAKKTGDRQAAARIAVRFFHTDAGLQAARYLAAVSLDRGEYSTASRWFGRVLQRDSDGEKDAFLLLQAAYANRRAGNDNDVAKLLKQIEAATGGKPVRIGDRTIDPAEWLDKHTREATDVTEMREWWMLFGNAGRNATVAGGSPLLLKRWSRPITHSHALRRKVDLLTETLADARRALVPAGNVLAVDGKIAFRTLRGVEVVDAETGLPLWETREGDSAEKLLTSGNISRHSSPTVFMNGMQSVADGSSADFDPLTGLLFRDGTHGLLSSDGERLFVIEEHALLGRPPQASRFGGRGQQGENGDQRWSANKLAAYDLKTGRPSWEVGGVERDDAFDLPLAGNYFLGVPAVDGDDLFVVAENNSRIRMFALNARTGEEKWSKLIAYADPKIETDAVRRWFTAQVAVEDGVVVCPTTVGWMVAVDRSNGDILWAHRYSPPNQRADNRRRHSGGPEHAVELKPLNQRWLPSAPVVVDGRIVYTPAEEDVAECLRLRDGKRLWRIARGDSLYLAGVFGQQALFVGKSSVKAVSLKTGTTSWTRPFPRESAAEPPTHPAGMGVAVGKNYHLPLQGGRLWTVDTETGKVSSKLFLPEDGGSLGNLAMYRGQVLSLSATGLTSYEQRESLAEEIRRRKAESPDDPWAKLKEAEIAILHRDYDESLKLLGGLKGDAFSEELRPRFREAKIRSLVAVVRSDFKRHDDLMRELDDLVESPDEQFLHRRLAAKRQRARGEFEEAFATYRQIARIDGDRTMRREDQRKIELDARLWVAGELQDLWREAPADARMRIGRKLDDEARELDGKSLAEQTAFTRLYAFHPAAAGVASRLAEAAAEANDFAQAEVLLLRLRAHADPQIAAAATERHARLLRSQNLHDDARQVYGELEFRFADAELPGGKTVNDLLAEFRREDASKQSDGSKPVSWARRRMRMEQSGTSYQNSPEQQLLLNAPRFPYFRNRSFRIDHGNQRLIVRRSQDDSIAWLAPLRSRDGAHGQNAAGESFGHFIVVMHRGVLHCLSPVDRRVLWTKPVGDESNHTVYSYYSSSRYGGRTQGMQSGSNLQNLLARNQQRQNGGVVFANEACIGLQQRRKLIVLDAASGRTLWTLRGLAPGGQVVGTTHAVFVLPPNGYGAQSAPLALRSADGKPLDDQPGLEAAQSAVAVYGRHILSMKSKSASFLGISRSEAEWRMVDVATGKSTWEKKFGNGFSFMTLESGEIAVLSGEGELQLIDPVTGAAQSSGRLEGGDRRVREVFVATDRDTLFVACNRSRSGHYYSTGGMVSVAVSGNLYAFDRKTQKRLWRQSVDNQQLIVDEFENSPVLTFMTRTYERNGLMQHAKIKLLVLDKRAGRKLFDRQFPSNQYYGSFAVNRAAKSVEFRTYNHRLRLIAEPSKPVAAPRPKKRP